MYIIKPVYFLTVFQIFILMPTNRYNSSPSSKTFLFAADWLLGSQENGVPQFQNWGYFSLPQTVCVSLSKSIAICMLWKPSCVLWTFKAIDVRKLSNSRRKHEFEKENSSDNTPEDLVEGEGKVEVI